MGSRLICELLLEKKILYVIPISSTLGKLPTVRAGDTGTIMIHYRCHGKNRFNRSVARADSAPGSGNGSPMYFVNSWDLGWSLDMKMKGISCGKHCAC